MRKVGYNKQNPKTNFVTLTYANKPPDDLIERLGELLEVNVNAKRRKEQRIVVDDAGARKMALTSKSAVIEIQGVPRNGILRDVSFTGAKILVVGVAKFLEQKDAILKLSFSDPPGVISIPGTIVRTEAVQGRKDITALAMHYDESKIPMLYKTKINNFGS